MNNEPKQGSGVPANDLMKPPAGSLSDADSEALGVVSAINQHEIAAAKQAQSHDLPPKVSTYAEMMVKDHTDNDAQIKALGEPRESAAVTAQKSKGEAELAALGVHKDDYAKAYVDGMVKGHTEALQALDEKLLPESQSVAVKDHLKKTRAAVVHHLDEAKSLQAAR
jgi:putative membrane protein